MRRIGVAAVAVGLVAASAGILAQGRGGRGGGAAADAPPIVLKPAKVFDGDRMHDGWTVVVRGGRIESAGPAGAAAPAGATTIDLPGMTLMPGMIEAHSHVLEYEGAEISLKGGGGPTCLTRPLSRT